MTKRSHARKRERLRRKRWNDVAGLLRNPALAWKKIIGGLRKITPDSKSKLMSKEIDPLNVKYLNYNFC